MKFNPWEAGRPALQEDERPYRDAKRNVTIPPIRFREMGTFEEDAFLARYTGYRKKYDPPRASENGNQPLQFPDKPAGPVPLFGDQNRQQAGNPMAPQQIPESAFERLPPQAKAGILAGIARKSGAGTLYEAPDGRADRLTDKLMANVALLETMQVSPLGTLENPLPPDFVYEPYTFDDWVGFAVNFKDAYYAMLIVCMCLNGGKPLPPIGQEAEHEKRLIEEQEAAEAQRPPEPLSATESAVPPDTSSTPSNLDSPIPIPSSTSVQPPDPAPPVSEPSTPLSPELRQALETAKEGMAMASEKRGWT